MNNDGKRYRAVRYRPNIEDVSLSYHGITMPMKNWVKFIADNRGLGESVVEGLLMSMLFDRLQTAALSIEALMNGRDEHLTDIQKAAHIRECGKLLKSRKVRIGGGDDAPSAKNAVKCGMDFGKGGKTVLVRIEPFLKVAGVQSAQTADGEDFEPKPVRTDPDVFMEKGRSFRQLRLPTMEGKNTKMFAAKPKDGETEEQYLRRIYRISKNGTVTRRCDGFEFKKTVWHGGERVKLPMPVFGAKGRTRKAVYKTYHVHRLVAMFYLPLYSAKRKVIHVDGNRMNNFVGNLQMDGCRYVDVSEIPEME